MSYIGKGVEVVTFNTATTLDVAGNITVGGTVDGRDVATDGTKLDTIAANAIANLSEDTTPQLGGNLDLNTSNVIGTGNINVTGSITGTSFVSTGDMSFTNNSKAIFGTSPSLEIYHDGSNSILDDVGAGNFKMQLAGADKLEITSTGVDVTGTLTATDATTTNNGLILQSSSVTKSALNVAATTNQGINGTAAGDQYNWTTGGKMLWSTNNGTNAHLILDSSGILLVGTTTSNSANVGHGLNPNGFTYHTRDAGEVLRLNRKTSDGDIVVFRKDNTTVGSIGSTSYADAYIAGASTGITFGGTNVTPTTNTGAISDNAKNLGGASARWQNLYLSGTLTNNGTGGINIDTSGNVGIGTSSPTSKLSVVSGTNAGITVNDGTVNTILFNTSSANGSVGTTTNHPMAFYSNNTERMRIDSSGQLIVGHTGAGSPYFNEGIVLNPAGDSVFHRDGNSVVDFSRQTSDGNIVRFVKDNSVVGSIGTYAGFITMGGGDTSLIFDATANTIEPFNQNDRTAEDAAITLGWSSNRFKDLYLSGSISDGTNSKTVADIVSGGGGGLIQTVSTHHVTSTTISGTAFTQYSGLNTSITPTSSSNKVLVTVHINMSAVGDSFPAFRIYRGGTWIGQSNTVSPGIETTFAHAVPTGGASATVQMGVASFTFLDSPSTTSATTYSVYISPMRTTSRTLRINESYSRGDDNQYSGGSTMILMEVT